MAQFDLTRSDTIVALATAPTPSALAVIRVSGPRADELRQAVFRPRKGRQRPFVQTLGAVVADADEGLIDEGLCTAFPAGRSYTGEPSFELSVHGGRVVVQRVLGRVEALGARPAEPGEFTLRAYLSGRMDLSAAEAVHDLVEAGSERAARQALMHLQGELKARVEGLRVAIVDALAELEARLDFPEEALAEADTRGLRDRLVDAEARLDRLVGSAAFGQRQREGARVVLVGRPNVGKSTLLNTLYGEARALVFDAPGTTRDALEVELGLDGYRVMLVDVAGLRETEGVDPVEALGIERVKEELQRASAALFLRDEPAHHADADARIRSQIPGHVPVVEVETKVDARPQPTLALAVSAHTGTGMDALRTALMAVLFDDSTEEVVLTRERHRVAIEASRDATREALDALVAGHPDEVVCGELRRAVSGLDTLLGADVNADVLETIFRRFCIGK